MPPPNAEIFLDRVVSGGANTGNYQLTVWQNPDSQDIIQASTATIPEPTSLMLGALGLAGLTLGRERRDAHLFEAAAIAAALELSVAPFARLAHLAGDEQVGAARHPAGELEVAQAGFAGGRRQGGRLGLRGFRATLHLTGLVHHLDVLALVLQAAADRWQLPRTELTTEAGVVALVGMASGAIVAGGMAGPGKPGVNEVRRDAAGALNESDVGRYLASIKEAAAKADIVIAYQHNHYWEKDMADTPPWQRALFTFMARNARSPTEFFGIPANDVVELGTQIEV